MPTDSGPRALAESRPLLQLIDVAREFDVSRPWLDRLVERAPRQTVQAVDGVGFPMQRRETLSPVGESGFGESTIAPLIVRLQCPKTGPVTFDSQPLQSLRSRT